MWKAILLVVDYCGPLQVVEDWVVDDFAIYLTQHRENWRGAIIRGKQFEALFVLGCMRAVFQPSVNITLLRFGTDEWVLASIEEFFQRNCKSFVQTVFSVELQEDSSTNIQTSPFNIFWKLASSQFLKNPDFWFLLLLFSMLCAISVLMPIWMTLINSSQITDGLMEEKHHVLLWKEEKNSRKPSQSVEL